MAFASPSPWMTTTGSPLTLSSSPCRTSSSSLIFSFSLVGTRTTTRRKNFLINFSFHHNSSSSSSSSENVPGAGKEELLKKKPMIQVGRGGSSMDSGNQQHLPTTKLTQNNSNMKNQNQNQSISIRLHSLFGKRPLWRRILFASKKVRSILLLNVITLIYASNIPVVKEIEAIMDPAAFTVVRFTLSAIPFIPFILKAHDDVQTRNSGIELGIWVSLGYLMQALGLLTSDAGRASFFTSFTVVVVPLLDGIFGAKVPTRTWLGAFMSLLGVSLLESSGSPPCVGDLLNFLSAVFFGVHMLRTEHISRNTKKSNFLALLGYEVFVVAIFSSVWYFIGGHYGGTHGWDPGSWTWTLVWNWIVEFPWIPALYTGVFSTGLCLWVEIAAMRDVSATETAIVYGLEPLWGAGFAWFLLGERWGTAGWIGAALILGGSLTVQIFGASSRTEEENSDQGGLLVSDKRKGFSPSTVVSSRKSVQDLFEKK